MNGKVSRNPHTVPCPMGQKCPSTVSKSHRPGSSELARHTMMASGQRDDRAAAFDRAQNAKPARGEMKPASSFRSIDEFAKKADVSFDEAENGDVTVTRGDADVSITVSKAEAESIAMVPADSDDFEERFLRSLNHVRTYSLSDVNEDAAFFGPPAELQSYSPAVREYLDVAESTLATSVAMSTAGGDKGVAAAAAVRELDPDGLVAAPEDETVEAFERVGRAAMREFGFRPDDRMNRSLVSAGGGFTKGATRFFYTNEQGEDASFEISGTYEHGRDEVTEEFALGQTVMDMYNLGMFDGKTEVDPNDVVRSRFGIRNLDDYQSAVSASSKRRNEIMYQKDLAKQFLG